MAFSAFINYKPILTGAVGTNIPLVDLPDQDSFNKYLLLHGGAAQSPLTPVAAAGNSLTITLPTSTATLMGTGSETGGTIASYAWREVTGPVTLAGFPAATQNVSVTGMTTAGTYQFGLIVTDANGVKSAESFTTITVNAAASAVYKAPRITIDGDSIATEDYAVWHADFQLELTNQLAAKTTAQLNAVGLTGDAPVFNWIGVSGQTAAMMDGLNGGTASDVDGSFDGTKYNLLLSIAEPYNTFRGPANVNIMSQQGADTLLKYCTDRKALHPWGGIVALIGFGDHYRGSDTNYNPPRAGFDTLMAQVVTYLQANTTAGGLNTLAIVDPVFDQTDSAQSVDGVHPTRAAYAASITKRLVAGAMQFLFGTAQPAAIPKPAVGAGLFNGAQYINFPTQVNEVPAGRQVTTRSGSPQTGYGGSTGLSDLMLAAGQSGRIILPVLALRDGIIGVSETYARTGYASFKAGFWLSTGSQPGVNDVLGTVDGGAASATATNVNSYADFCLNRTGSVWTVEGWNGSAWTVVKTLAYAGTGNAYICLDLYKTGGIDSAQGTNLTAAVVATGSNYTAGATQIIPNGPNLVTTNGVTTSTAGTGYGVYGATGTTPYKIAGRTSGAFGFRTISASDYDAVVGFKLAASAAGYANMQAGVWNASTDPSSQSRVVASLINGAPMASTTPVRVGDFVYCRATYNAGTDTTALTAEVSTDGGNTWTVIRSLGSTAGAIDLLCVVDVSGPGQIDALQGVGLTTA
jgi:hypothetical protein